MDELILDDKKYVSTKLAAKLTGYAKDYVGQLCREGRIPARMVGRSWYVLSSAIQDHRFGQPEEDTPDTSVQPGPFSTWAAPQYEAVQDEPLPQINRLEARDDTEPSRELRIEDAQELTKSWGSWFATAEENNHEANIEYPGLPEVSQAELELPTSEASDPEPTEEGVRIPIHTVYAADPRPDMVAPIRRRAAEPAVNVSQAQTRITSKRSNTALQALLYALALISVSIAAVGTGYVDSYTSSFKPAQIIAGVSIYNK